MEVSSHLMLSKNQSKKQNSNVPPRTATTTSVASSTTLVTTPSKTESENLTDELKRRVIVETCGGIQEKTKILSLRNKPVDLSEQFYPDCLKTLYSNSLNHSAKKVVSRAIQPAPDRILDAPDFRDDYCKYSFLLLLSIL